MDSNSLLPNPERVKKWQASLWLRRDITGEYLRPLYIRSFAWIGSVEPCTGVLCETCQRCLRDSLILKVRRESHHATASSMFAAVKIGCRICTCLWRQFTGDRSVDPGHRLYHTFSFPFSECLPNPRLNPNSGVTLIVFGKHYGYWHLTPSTIRNEMVPQIDGFSYQNDRNNLMNQYWKLANGWLSGCLSHHTSCKHVINTHNYCPTRLIEVRVNSLECELRLYSTSNGPIKEPYMTLSHCWGKSQFLRLTASTLDRLQKGFALAELPPTFQDAIIVTRALGINFLWIDALCIIQDSIIDWQQEAIMMSQVYSHSLCNISALDAQDSTGGLFFDRGTLKMPYCTLKSCGKFRRKQLYDIEYADLWSHSVQHAPLICRAWVVQERLLAPRVLHFGKKQLLWECNELRACEVYPRGMRAFDPLPIDHSTGDKFLKESLTTVLQGGLDNALISSQIHRAWNDLVQYYTKCNLTMSEDKLVAISGIVKRLQPLLKTDYLAGLWRDCLLDQMLWNVDSDETSRSLAGEKRPDYRAPSWSWASIDAPIRPQLLPNRLVDHIATIQEAHVTPVTGDVTGQIKNGYIRLRAALFPVKIDTSSTQYKNLSWHWGRLESFSKVIPDIWPQSAVEGLHFVPILISVRPIIEPSLEGLIIQPVEGKRGVYQRWGHIVIWCKRKLEKEFLNFGVQLINDKCTYKYNPPEKYPEQIITLI